MSGADRFDDLAARLDAMAQDIRKQGRASVAAHAAAESCLQGVRDLQQQIEQSSALVGMPKDAPDSSLLRVVRSLLPFADSLDRAVELSRAATTTATVPPRATWLSRWLGLAPTAPSVSPETAALATGLALLQQQLRSIFQELEVDVELRSGIPVDPDIHRVVEVRRVAPNGTDAPSGTVIEVVRPGYACSGIRLREAEVVASGPTDERDSDVTDPSRRLET